MVAVSVKVSMPTAAASRWTKLRPAVTAVGRLSVGGGSTEVRLLSKDAVLCDKLSFSRIASCISCILTAGLSLLSHTLTLHCSDVDVTFQNASCGQHAVSQ